MNVVLKLYYSTKMTKLVAFLLLLFLRYTLSYPFENSGFDQDVSKSPHDNFSPEGNTDEENEDIESTTSGKRDIIYFVKIMTIKIYYNVLGHY